MSRRWVWVGLVLVVFAGVSLARAQVPGPRGVNSPAGTGFTYQGRLTDGGNPVDGACDFKFSLYDAASGGNPVGSTLTKSSVTVSDGTFTVQLDFGSSAFDGNARWLKVQVRCPAGSGSYSLLNPRQEVRPAPYALYSLETAPHNHWEESWTGTGIGLSLTSSDGTGLSSQGDGYGVLGTSTGLGGAGVYGHAYGGGSAIGVYGSAASSSGTGVSGNANSSTGTTNGVYGESRSTAGRGVYGYASASTGTTTGVYGYVDSTAGRGVVGVAAATSGSTRGVYGRTYSSGGIAVYGQNSATSGGWAGYFSGNVHVVGDLSATGSKPFKIDHPLEPANRYLYHFAQEAPEVQNVYNGVATLDANGAAVVTLPAYFSTLNTGPFRYQLTPIGGPMPNLYIAHKIQGNRFQIAGGKPGLEVSWEVTAQRNDPYLRDHPTPTEQDKPPGEQGTYLYPAGYGQPAELGLDYQLNAAFEAISGQSPHAPPFH